MGKRILAVVMLWSLLLPAIGLAERYENWYDMYTGIVEGDDVAVYTGGDRIIGATEFTVSPDREVHISADPPVTIQGTIAICGGNFTFTGIDLVSAPGELRREPLEVVGRPSTGIPQVTFYGNLSSLSKSGSVRWGITCVDGIIHVVGDVGGGRQPGHNNVIMAYNAQVTIEGKVRTLVDGKETEAVEADWFWLRDLQAEDGEHDREPVETWVKIIDPESGTETVYRPEEAE